MEWKFKISVIVPVYNTGKYVEGLLYSIMLQTVGFEQNIQVIFVNDGSTDDSGAVCTQASLRYPENMKCINLDKNRGVSFARNKGMEYAEGKYITFMDSDDLWSLNAFEEALAFLEEHDSVIDLVSADIEAFEAYTQPHILNQNLDVARVIDMNTEYYRIRVNGPCCIMKTEVARRHHFQEQQCCWEDTVFINQVMLERQMYGMLSSDVKYYYRRRKENNSASQLYGHNKQYYMQDLELVFKGLYDESVEKCGLFMPMMQYLMAYALAYRFVDKNEILNAEEEKQYFDTIYQILQYIEDQYLAGICNANEVTKKEMLAFKRGIDLREMAAEWEETRARNRYLQQRLAVGNANYKVLKKWFELRAKGKKIDTFLIDNCYYRIAIYGMSDLGKYVVQELRDSKVEIIYGIDRRAESMEADFPILQVKEDLPEVDAIIVTAVFYYDEIQNELSKKVEIPIISIEDMIRMTI